MHPQDAIAPVPRVPGAPLLVAEAQVKAYDSVLFVAKWPYEMQVRWVVRQKRPICQRRYRLPKLRWSRWEYVQ